MGELGIDISSHWSKSVSEFLGAEFDLVVTVCDGAAQDCPVWLGDGKVAHIGFDDPAAATGDDEERLNAFRNARDGLRERVLAQLEMLAGTDNVGDQERIGEYGTRYV
jgi:arsenate reductase